MKRNQKQRKRSTHQPEAMDFYGISPTLYEKVKSHPTNKEVYFCSNEIPIPITTRGIGFLVSKYFNELMAMNFNYNEEYEDIIYVVYRISLLQLEKQLYQQFGFNLQNYFFGHRDEINFIPKFNFSLIAALIGIVGKFEIDNYSYEPILLDSLENDQIYNNNNKPNPFTVSFKNLPKIVEFLSNDNPDYLEARKYFYKNNPIPKATWNDNFVLQNGNLIMPQDYSIVDDKNKFNEFMHGLKLKVRTNLEGKCSLDGQGNPALLASVVPFDGMNYNEGKMSEELETFYTQIRSAVFLTSEQRLLGFIALIGERYPDDDRDDNWAIRSPYMSRGYSSVKWSHITNLTIGS